MEGHDTHPLSALPPLGAPKVLCSFKTLLPQPCTGFKLKSENLLPRLSELVFWVAYLRRVEGKSSSRISAKTLDSVTSLQIRKETPWEAADRRPGSS